MLPVDRSVAATFVVGTYLLLGLVEIHLAAQYFPPILSAVDLTTALPVPLVWLMGSTALVAIPVGFALSDVVSNAAGVGTLVGIGVHLFLGYSGAKLSERYDLFAHGALPMAGPATLARLGLISGLATIGSAAVAGWLSELFHLTPFYVAAWSSFLETFVMVLLFTIPLVFLLHRVFRGIETHTNLNLRRMTDFHEEFNSVWILGISLAWFLAGTVGSITYRVLERIPPIAFHNRGLEFLMVIDNPAIFGSGASRVHVLFGALFASILIIQYIGSMSGERG